MIKQATLLIACCYLSIQYSSGQTSSIETIDSLYEIGFRLRNGPIDSAFHLIKKSGEISVLENHSFGILRSQIFSLFYYGRKGQLDTAELILHNVMMSLNHENELIGTKKEGLAYYYAGVVKWRAMKLAESKSYYIKALEVFERLNDQYYIPTTYSRLGLIELNQSNYPKALELFVKAYEMKLGSNRPSYEYAPELANIARVYQRMGLDSSALLYARKSLVLEISRQNHLNAARNLLIIGATHNSNNTDSSIYYYTKAFETASTYGFIKTAIIAKYEIAKVLSKDGEFANSNKILKKMIDLNKESYSDLKLDITLLLATNYFNLLDIENAIEYGKISFELSLKSGARLISFESADLLSKCFEVVRKPDSVIYFMKQYHEIKESVYNQKNQAQIASLNADLENLNIQKEIEILEKEKELESANAALLTISLIAFVIVATLIIGLMIYRFKSNQRKERLRSLQLERDKEELDEELYNQTMHMINLNNSISEIQSSLAGIRTKAFITRDDVQSILSNIKMNKTVEKEWKNFDTYFGKKYKNFYENLISKHPELSVQNRRLAALVRIDLNNKEVAQILNISHNSAKMGRYRLKSKLGLEEKEDLTKYLLEF